jgi:aminomethyltransferase
MDENPNDPVTTETRHTPLYQLHIELGARMVPFAGYEMPVQYPTGIRAEHEHTRNAAGLFDISHMGQIRVDGDDVATRLESLVPGDIKGLALWQQRYSVLTNAVGGVIDDLMITRMPDHHFLVVNASRKQVDHEYLVSKLQHCRVTHLTDRGLLALQGPAAATVLAELAPETADMSFLSAIEARLDGISCLVHRCGYTGEDGYEISVHQDDTERLARRLLAHPLVKPVGLGARDSLRLEAGLSLYGHELDETTTPIEAGLDWVIARKYRTQNPEQAGFPGAKIILDQLREGPSRIRQGFRPEGKIPVRDGTIIYDGEQKKAGIITSGAYGQTAGGPVAIGFVQNLRGGSTDYTVEIRNQHHRIVVVDLPFVKHRYYRKPR